VKPCTSRAILVAAALLACGANCNVTRANDETAAMKELIPTGKLRVGIVFAPALSAFFAVKDADGRPRGVTVDLANELAQQLGVAPEFMVVPNSGLATDATAYVSAFLENAKASGSVRRALDRAGFRDEPVAPPGR
jgi:ABC-type amino acid transport substrate-binding protein